MHCACATASPSVCTASSASTAKHSAFAYARSLLSRLITFTGVAQDGNDSLIRTHPARDLDRGMYVRARRRAYIQPLLTGQPRGHALGIEIGDRHHLVDLGHLEHVGHEAR